MGRVILDWHELASTLDERRRAGESIVSTNGVFDVLHVGHARYLQAARSLGDLLVVGVNSDSGTRSLKGPTRPFVPQAERMELLAALACVDFVTLFGEPSPEALLELIRPGIHAKGGDYHPALLPEAAVVERHGGRLAILPFESGYSTTDFVERIGRLLAGRE